MQRISVHKFDCIEGCQFNESNYSKFKYGHMQSTLSFARELATKLAPTIMDTVKEGEELFVSGAPYNQVPVASTALAEYTVAYLQNMLLPHSSTRLGEWITIKTFKVSRQHSYHDDYGRMSKEDREKSITGETFHVEPQLLAGKHVLFIDDIYITGAHERRVHKMVEGLDIQFKSLNYAYYAELNGECNPEIESFLNHSFIHNDGGNVVGFVKNSELILNTRVTKFLLSLPTWLFRSVLMHMSWPNTKQLWKAGLANRYSGHELYKVNFTILTNKIDHNERSN